MTESTMRTHCNFIGLSKEGSIGVTMPFCESKVNPFLVTYSIFLIPFSQFDRL